jgi:hypothetical protein
MIRDRLQGHARRLQIALQASGQVDNWERHFVAAWA